MNILRISLEDQADFRKGLQLFNDAHFFEAHEALEDAWRVVPTHTSFKLHVQGLVQLAVAFHHQSTGNSVGARSVLARALRNLRGGEATFPKLDLARLRDASQQWLDYLANVNDPGTQSGDEGCKALQTPPPLPKILPLP